MRRFLLALAAGLAIGGCGGGGGGGAPALLFALSGTVPPNGAIGVSVDAALVITFNLPADLASVTSQAVQLARSDGLPVALDIQTRSFNRTNVQLVPLAALDPNEVYRLTIRAAIRSSLGETLGSDVAVCFATANPVPTVRPDQLLDLGERLVRPRYLARTVRIADGRNLIFGGYTAPGAITDTIEVWDPARRVFDLLSTRMLSPRAEHTLTVMADGRVLIAGGRGVPGGPPLATTEIFDPRSNGILPGPDMLEARRWHAASTFRGGASVMVSGGFGADGKPLATGEFLEGGAWKAVPGLLPNPSAQQVQVSFGFDQVYVGVGNLFATGALFDGSAFVPRTEGDIRFRAGAARVDSDRVLVVGGDTRSIVIFDFGTRLTVGATDFLRDRRGAFSFTPRDGTGRRFLAAGGFQISAPGSPPLRTLEVVEYLPGGSAGLPDAVVWPVENVLLPVPFAGHVGFLEASGATVLAGGFGDGIGPHSRRVVLVLDAGSTPPPGCD